MSHEFPDQPKSPKETLYTLQQRLLVGESLSEEERIRITESLMELSQPERRASACLDMLKNAFSQKDKQELQYVLEVIKREIERGGLKAADPSDRELDTALESSEIMISVGSGTSGQRLYIEKGKLYMPTGDEQSQSYGVVYQGNFRRFFHLGPKEEMRVSFA